ncbi:MAG: helix-turn-helix domain-containing protein [Myxococcota bacterium]
MGASGKRLVSVKAAAEVLDVHEKTVRRWCQRGEVQAVLTPGGRGVWRVWVDADGVVVRP